MHRSSGVKDCLASESAQEVGSVAGVGFRDFMKSVA